MQLQKMPTYLTFLFLLLTFTAGCDKKPRILALDSHSVILAFGDSLTYGTGATRSETYPALLRSRLDLQVINAGVPGETSAEGLDRLPSLLEEHRPNLVILCHGGNDFLRRLDSTKVKENLMAMIEFCQKAGADVILVGVPQLGLFLSPSPLYEEVANAYHIPLEKDALTEILGDNRLKSDTIHPNNKGYALLAEKIGELIESSQD